ncbi:MAG: hypothetical protein IJK41_05955 [Muribaculaceae bacterium]|nr:hypothetical protein [Muribaculaceae bacterium]
MRFTKHNITKGKSANSATTTTTVSNPTVDLSGVYSRMGEDEARIGTLENQVEQLNTTTSGLDNKYLRKDKTDSTEYTLTMGKAKSNYFVSGKYDTTGIGFSLA